MRVRQVSGTALRDSHGQRWRQGIRSDENFRIQTNGVEEFDDILGFHANTTIAYGPADIALLGRAMNVDIAAVGIAIFVIKTFQPENARNDGITTRRIHREDFASGLAAFENRSGRQTMANFFFYAQYAKRRGVGTGPVANAEFGSGHRVNREGLAIAENEHFLICNAHDHSMAIIGDASGEQDGNKQQRSVKMNPRER
jgi:hypothetical protein